MLRPFKLDPYPDGCETYPTQEDAVEDARKQEIGKRSVVAIFAIGLVLIYAFVTLVPTLPHFGHH
jgi:hypothetical protein